MTTTVVSYENQMKAARIDRIKQRAAAWDKQFTFKANELNGDSSIARVEAAWLAGYRAGKEAIMKRRSKANRGGKPNVHD